MSRAIKKESCDFMYIENVVIGKPIINESVMFSTSQEDWVHVEKNKTVYTDERFLPKILVNLGIVPSVSEVRRNKPELVKTLDSLDFIEAKWGKRKLWILVGG